MRDQARLERDAEAIKADCVSLTGFVRHAWHILHPETPYVHGWHIDAICSHLEAVSAGRITRLLINVPPGTMKSLLVSVFWPAWEWTTRPSLQYLTTSYSEGYVKRDSRRMRDLVESEWYQRLWGDRVKLSRTAEISFENTAKGFREGKAFASLTGGRGDRVIIDDPHSTETAESEAERNNTARIFRESVPTRLNDPKASAIVIIMQRLHESDVSGQILALKLGYDHLMLPMEYEPERRCMTSIGFEDPRSYEGELLFPERFPREVVDRDKVPMGSYAVAGQFQQRPSPREGGLFKRHWFERVPAAPAQRHAVRGWDLAGSKKKAGSSATGGPAYTAGVKLSESRGVFYIEHAVRERGSPADVERIIKATAVADGKGVRVSIPQDPGQAALAQKASYAKLLAGWDVRFSTESGEKEQRATPVSAQAEAGNVKIVATGDIAKDAWIDPFLDEVCLFPGGSFKDQTDAMSRAFGELLGARVFEGDEADVIIDPIQIPRHWPRVWALDVSRGEVSCVFGALNRANDTVYLYDEYAVRRSDMAVHAAAISSRGSWIPGVLAPRAHGRSEAEGDQIVDRLVNLRLDVFVVDDGEEGAVEAVATRLSGKRLRVFRTMTEWVSQYRNSERDAKGELQQGGLMRATGLLCLSGLDVAGNDIALEQEAESEWAEESRSNVTGY